MRIIMPKPDIAYIKFKVSRDDEDFSEIRFHSVISEEHAVSNEITKFPVQSGFDVSNHSIKKNRIVVLAAMVTNTQMLLSTQYYDYSTVNNSKAMFEILETLVREAIVCTVVTNLGEYTPVIFNKFKTKQEAGMTDAMSFILTGEELQIGGVVSKADVEVLNFTVVPDERRAAKIEELKKAGYDILATTIISEAKADLSVGFGLNTQTTSGESATITYDNIGYDPTTAEHSFECSFTPDGTVVDTETGEILQPAIPTALQNGANVFGSCFLSSATDIAVDAAQSTISTAMGELRNSIYGGIYETLGLNGEDTLGQKLLSLGIDCFIVGVTAAVTTDEVGNSLISADEFPVDIPTTDDALKGAAKYGDSLALGSIGIASPTTITKLSGSPDGLPSFLGDLL